MYRQPTELNLVDRKIDLIMQLFVDPADEDYVLARSAYTSGLFRAFYWPAAQACEKYMKAALLLHDQSVKGYNHSLLDLFKAVVATDVTGIIPQHIDLPDTNASGRALWDQKSLSLFVDYLETYGSPDNRYGVIGTFINGPILYAMDIFAFSIRKLIRVSNLTHTDLFFHQCKARGVSHQEKSEPWMIDPERLLERLFNECYQVGQGPLLRKMFSNMNSSFFAHRDSSDRTFGGQHMMGSPLYNHLVRFREIDPSPENVRLVDEMRDWALQNIQMSRSLRTHLKYE